MRLHGRAASALLSVLAIGLAAPLTAQEAGDPDGLRIVTSFEILSMDPYEEGFWMQEFGVAELLMKFEPDGLHPWLLEAIDTPDPLTWVLTLREGVTFQNGRALDAQGVLDAIDLQLAHSAGAAGAVPEGTTFERTGDLEITVRTAAPWPGLPSTLANESVFLIFDADAVKAAGGDWESLEGAGLYTGPYAVEDLDAARLELARFDGYWRGTPALPGITVSFVTDPNARILAVQNGEADIALYPPIAAFPVVDATPGLHFNSGTPGTGGFLGFMNVAEPPLDEVAVRRALLRAVDYRRIAEDVFGGHLAQAEGLYNTDFDWALPNYATDREEAARLLDEAGWALGADGRRMRDGEPLVLDVLIYPQQPDLVPLSGDLQAQLAEMGIGVEIRVADDIYEALGGGEVEWDLGISSEGTVSWGSTERFLRRYLTPGGERNFAGYDNAELTALVEELEVTADLARRTEILREVQRILVEEDPYAFAFNIHKGRVVVNDLYAGYQPGFALHHVTWETAPSPAAE
jgi:peptide/nickel transport system substrate-binding protein